MSHPHDPPTSTRAAGLAPPAPFDASAAGYDAGFTDSDLGRRLRGVAWAWMDRAFGPGDRVLDLGCGTGVDAAHLASRGVRVVATDVSARMLEATRQRALLHGVNELVRILPLDARTIGQPGWSDDLGGPYDGALADFGVVNCLPDRARLLRGLTMVVRPGGRVILVVMGPLCPWEIAWHLAHAEPRAAVRRWRAGARAPLAHGASIRVWYPSAPRVAREAAPWFRVRRVGGIGVALPPSGLAAAMEGRGRLLEALAPLERALGGSRLAARVADHWVMELERRAA